MSKLAFTGKFFSQILIVSHFLYVSMLNKKYGFSYRIPNGEKREEMTIQTVSHL